MRRVGSRSILTLYVCLASALTATAQIPLGPEFRVDTGGAGESWSPSVPTPRTVAVDADGRFVVTFRAPDPHQNDIQARRFEATGRPRGPEFRVNSYTSGWVIGHSMASDGAGNFVVVWDSPEPFTGAIVGRRFDAAGVGLGAEFLLNDATSAGQAPFLAMTPLGEFAVAWSGNGIWARRYDAAGVPLSGPFVVNTSTTSGFSHSTVAYDGAGNFVVVWGRTPGPDPGYVRGRLFDAAGAPQGAEFVVAPGTAPAYRPRVGRARDGSFVVAWESGVFLFAQRFDSNAAPVGPELTVTTFASTHSDTDLAVDRDGDFVIVWDDQDRILGRRFEAAGTAGPQFAVATHTAYQLKPSVAADPAGNFIVSWRAGVVNVSIGAYARRFAGGLMGTGLSVSDALGDANGVIEAAEPIYVAPRWLNASPGTLAFTGTVTSFSGPGVPGDPAYTIFDGSAGYGTVPTGLASSCITAPRCYRVGIVGYPTTRPALHWDATMREEIAPANLGAARNWTLHIGDSFPDVPRSNVFYRFVETILHHNVTVGCTATTYCPATPTTREQMAVFVLVAKEGNGYAPPACTTPVFSDVPASSPFCGWIEELARRGVVSGCGGGNYCPSTAVSREEMAVFVLATKDPGVLPPACGAPMFGDVPASSGFCPWIEELARRGVVTGCGGGAYCPAAAVTREQMSVFLTGTFGLLLYGP